MEELKLILATIEALGETGSWMFYAYLAKSTFMGILIAGTIFSICRMIVSVISFGNDIRDMLNIGSTGSFTPSEKTAVLNKIGQLMKKEE